MQNPYIKKRNEKKQIKKVEKAKQQSKKFKKKAIAKPIREAREAYKDWKKKHKVELPITSYQLIACEYNPTTNKEFIKVSFYCSKKQMKCVELSQSDQALGYSEIAPLADLNQRQAKGRAVARVKTQEERKDYNTFGTDAQMINTRGLTAEAQLSNENSHSDFNHNFDINEDLPQQSARQLMKETDGFEGQLKIREPRDMFRDPSYSPKPQVKRQITNSLSQIAYPEKYDPNYGGDPDLQFQRKTLGTAFPITGIEKEAQEEEWSYQVTLLRQNENSPGTSDYVIVQTQEFPYEDCRNIGIEYSNDGKYQAILVVKPQINKDLEMTFYKQMNRSSSENFNVFKQIQTLIKLTLIVYDENLSYLNEHTITLQAKGTLAEFEKHDYMMKFTHDQGKQGYIISLICPDQEDQQGYQFQFFQFEPRKKNINHIGNFSFQNNEYPDDFYTYLNRQNQLVINCATMIQQPQGESYKIICAETPFEINETIQHLNKSNFNVRDTFKQEKNRGYITKIIPYSYKALIYSKKQAQYFIHSFEDQGGLRPITPPVKKGQEVQLQSSQIQLGGTQVIKKLGFNEPLVLATYKNSVQICQKVRNSFVISTIKKNDITQIKLKIKGDLLKQAVGNTKLLNVFASVIQENDDQSEQQRDARMMFKEGSNEIVLTHFLKDQLTNKYQVHSSWKQMKEFDTPIIHWPLVAYTRQRMCLEIYSVDLRDQFMTFKFQNEDERIMLIAPGFGMNEISCITKTLDSSKQWFYNIDLKNFVVNKKELNIQFDISGEDEQIKLAPDAYDFKKLMLYEDQQDNECFVCFQVKDRIFALSENYKDPRMSQISYKFAHLEGKELFFVDNETPKQLQSLDIFNMQHSKEKLIVEIDTEIQFFQIEGDISYIFTQSIQDDHAVLNIFDRGELLQEFQFNGVEFPKTLDGENVFIQQNIVYLGNYAYYLDSQNQSIKRTQIFIDNDADSQILPESPAYCPISDRMMFIKRSRMPQFSDRYTYLCHIFPPVVSKILKNPRRLNNKEELITSFMHEACENEYLRLVKGEKYFLLQVFEINGRFSQSFKLCPTTCSEIQGKLDISQMDASQAAEDSSYMDMNPTNMSLDKYSNTPGFGDLNSQPLVKMEISPKGNSFVIVFESDIGERIVVHRFQIDTQSQGRHHISGVTHTKRVFKVEGQSLINQILINDDDALVISFGKNDDNPDQIAFIPNLESVNPKKAQKIAMFDVMKQFTPINRQIEGESEHIIPRKFSFTDQELIGYNDKELWLFSISRNQLNKKQLPNLQKKLAESNIQIGNAWVYNKVKNNLKQTHVECINQKFLCIYFINFMESLNKEIHQLLLWRIDGTNDSEFYLYDINKQNLIIQSNEHLYILQQDQVKSIIDEINIVPYDNFNIIRLDHGLPNILFQGNIQSFRYQEVHFTPSGFKSESPVNMYTSGGMRMSRDESYVISDIGVHYSTSQYALLSKSIGNLDSTLENFYQLNFDELCYLINGKTCIFDYCIDFKRLSYILSMFQVYDKRLILMTLYEYFSYTLTKQYRLLNNVKYHGNAQSEFDQIEIYETSLDKCMRKNSVKSIELLLTNFSTLSEYNLSRLFFNQFTELLELGLPSFNDFLDNCSYQTRQMKYITSMAMDQTDNGQFLGESDTSLLNKNFESAFAYTGNFISPDVDPDLESDDDDGDESEEADNDRVKRVEIGPLGQSIIEKKQKIQQHQDRDETLNALKNVQVKALEWDWMFQEQEGQDFLESLSKTSNTDVFSSVTLRMYIDVIWGKTRPQVLKLRFIPFILSFILFTFYSTVGVLAKINLQGQWVDNQLIVSIIAMAITLYSLIFEILKIKSLKCSYITFWNIIFFISVIFNVTLIIVDLSDTIGAISADREVLQGLFAFSMLFLYFQCFYFLRIFKKTANMVRMIFEITKDMVAFLIMMMIAIFALAHWTYIFTDQGFDSDIAGDNFATSLINAYLVSIGDFASTEGYSNRKSGEISILWIFFFFATLFVMIILLNLLIAIMGDTYGRVSEIGENAAYLELVQMIVENRYLVSQKHYKNIKYLILVTDEDYSQCESTKLTSKQQIKETVNAMQQMLNNLEDKVEGTVERKGNKIQRSQGQMEERLKELIATEIHPTKEQFNTLNKNLEKIMKNYN